MKIYKTAVASLAALAAAGTVVLAPIAQAKTGCTIPAVNFGQSVVPAWKVNKYDYFDTIITARAIDLHTDVTPKVGILPQVNAAKQTQESTRPYTDEELEMLACCIYCEAGGDSASDETRRMVGEVVLNRVADPRFPDSIKAVLTQRAQYGRFFWTGIVWPSRSKNEPEAVQRAYDCAVSVFTQERLLPTDTVFQAEFRQGKECVAEAPGFYFCR